jgi:hypothetical protein
MKHLQHPADRSETRETHACNMHQKATARPVSSSLPSPARRLDAASSSMCAPPTAGVVGADGRWSTGKGQWVEQERRRRDFRVPRAGGARGAPGGWNTRGDVTTRPGKYRSIA